MSVYEVANIEEAVELAYQFKAEGRFDWFRGQVHDWPPHATLARAQAADPSAGETQRRRVEFFVAWVNSVPQLQYLATKEHVHDLFAVMQHYGIPTYYIDFTTDPGVAGFFACDTQDPPPTARSCIYCLDTQELSELWEILRTLDERRGAELELVTIDVRNLFRLQAQQGVFLYSNWNWDMDFPMDRIVFPYTGYPSSPTRDRIYPEHKSSLEELLDRFFAVEQSKVVGAELRQWMEDLEAAGGNAAWADWVPFDDGYFPEAFSSEKPPEVLESWRADALRPWEIDVGEDFKSTVGAPITLRLRPGDQPKEVRQLVVFGVRQVLRSQAEIRSRAIDWEFADAPAALPERTSHEVVRPIWNGMRRLPFTDDDIAHAIGGAVALTMLGGDSIQGSAEEARIFELCFGECMRVGFTAADGSGSTGLASLAGLLRALRSDMQESLTADFAAYADDMKQLFRIIYDPRRMFAFDAFSAVFAREVIAAQVAFGRSPIIYNPSQLIVFGIP